MRDNKEHIVWWPPAQAEEVARQISAGTRGRTWLGAVTAPDGKVTLRTRDTSATYTADSPAPADINESHVCPPATDCPK